MSKLTFEQFSELEAKYEAGTATADDLAALEPYRAKRAVLLASGFGSRMLPITINTPKPLVDVNGQRIIETLLSALLAADITEIYIVTGYKRECFELLKRDYPMVTLLENPIYASTNNISSACVAKDHFSNAYVFESDLYLRNPALIKKYRYQSCYMGVPVNKTPDWCFETENGIITDLHKGEAIAITCTASATGPKRTVRSSPSTCQRASTRMTRPSSASGTMFPASSAETTTV